MVRNQDESLSTKVWTTLISRPAGLRSSLATAADANCPNLARQEIANKTFWTQNFLRFEAVGWKGGGDTGAVGGRGASMTILCMWSFTHAHIP